MRALKGNPATPSRGGVKNQKAIARANGASWRARVGKVRKLLFEQPAQSGLLYVWLSVRGLGYCVGEMMPPRMET